MNVVFSIDVKPGVKPGVNSRDSVGCWFINFLNVCEFQGGRW